MSIRREDRLDEACDTCHGVSYLPNCRNYEHRMRKLPATSLRANIVDINSELGPTDLWPDVCAICHLHESDHVNGQCLLAPTHFKSST